MDMTDRQPFCFLLEINVLLNLQDDGSIIMQYNIIIVIYISLASRDAYFAVKYNSLLANIAEVGRDVKPAYTNNKSSSERLRKSKMAIMNDNIVINVIQTIRRHSNHQEYYKRSDGRA